MEKARAEPAALWIGFELRYKRAVRTIEKALAHQLPNLIVLHLDARRISEVFSPQTFDEFYMNFPSPWEKRRHEKHRLCALSFVTQLSQLLKLSGRISMKTDNDNYFHDFARAIELCPDITVSAKAEDLYQTEFVLTNIVTEFESMFIAQGRTIHYLECTRSGV